MASACVLGGGSRRAGEAPGLRARSRRLACALAAGVGLLAPNARAGPPLISDDPYTIGPGRVEAIFALQTAGERGADLIDVPVFDLTVGLLDGLDFVLVAAPSFVLEPADARSPRGSVNGGVKWQPISTAHWAASFTPVIGTDVLSAEQFFLYFPVQVEYAHGPFSIGFDVGYQVVRRENDAWNASVYGVWQARPTTAWMAEVWALSPSIVEGTDFGLGVGVEHRLFRGLSLLAMAGTGIDSTLSPRVQWVGYLGFLWAFRAFGDPDADLVTGRPGSPGDRARATAPRVRTGRLPLR